MSDQFLAEIRVVGFDFPPTGWAYCDGQLMPISQNTALFALLGTNYGGDGKSTFGLPDLQESVAVGAGAGAGLTQRFEGEVGGAAFVTLIQSEIPAHTHNVQADIGLGALGTGAPDVCMARSVGGFAYKANSAGDTDMAPQTLAPAGGGLPHNNLMPYLTLNFVIALQGVFPQRP